MLMKQGIDVGNYDTKTRNTTTPSSYKKYQAENIMDEESIYYEGNYYSPTNERNNQQLDKTIDNYCIIISLFAIAKESIFRIRSEHPNYTREDIQNEINKITEISLGIGLPAGHFSALSKKTTGLYSEKMKDGIQFTYRQMNDKFTFNLKLVSCRAFPQDYTGIAFNKTLEVPQNFSEYYIVGIGGGTVDIIPVSNSRPQVEKCVTLEKGTTVMYSEIIKTIQHETGKTMEYGVIESVLLGNPTVIDESRKKRIFEITEAYANKLVDEIAHQGMKLSDYPCVFIGGGALMMKPYLETNPLFVKIEFVMDVRANAAYFEEFI